MTRLRLLVLLALVTAPAAHAQERPAPDPADVSTVDGVIGALYASISGPVGQARQWDRFHGLFHPEARLIPTGCRSADACTARVLTPDGYQALADSVLTAVGFRENEIGRRTERFGAVAHAFSAYESLRFDETEPFSRGINSIQLFWDGARWWVVSVFWDAERPGLAIPADLIGAGG